MKEKASPAVVAVGVIIVLAIIAFIGFKMFSPEGNTNTEEMRKKYMGPTGYRSMTPPADGGTSSGPPPGAPPGWTPGKAQPHP